MGVCSSIGGAHILDSLKGNGGLVDGTRRGSFEEIPNLKFAFCNNAIVVCLEGKIRERSFLLIHDLCCLDKGCDNQGTPCRI